VWLGTRRDRGTRTQAGEELRHFVRNPTRTANCPATPGASLTRRVPIVNRAQATTEVRRAQDAVDGQQQVQGGAEDAFSTEIMQFIADSVDTPGLNDQLGAIAAIGTVPAHVVLAAD
jgi:hypothetical protein